MDNPVRRPQDEDNDLRKGATEDEGSGERAQNSMHGQLPHRGKNSLVDSLIKDSDTDYPEPGNNPEHSGQREEEQPLHWQKEEPLAS